MEVIIHNNSHKVVKNSMWFLILIQILVIQSCGLSNADQKKLEDEQIIISTIEFYIDSLIYPNLIDGISFKISEKFYDKLDTVFFNQTITETDNIFKNSSAIDLRNQYMNLKFNKLNTYLNDNHKKLLTNKKPSIEGEILFIISPPIFNITKDKFILYSKSNFIYKGEEKWYDRIFVCSNTNGNISLDYIIEYN